MIKSIGRQVISLSIGGQVGTIYLIGEMLRMFRPIPSRDITIELAQVRRVLVIKLDEIGDVVLTTGFLRELRALLPQTEITLVVKPLLQNLVETCPYIDEVLFYDHDMTRWLRPLLLPWRAIYFAWRHLRLRQFDLAIIPRWDTDSCYAILLAYFSGSRWRVGYSEHVNGRKKVFNRGFGRLLTHVPPDEGYKHEVEHNLDVIRFLGGLVHNDGLELWTRPEDEMHVEGILRGHDVRPGDIMVAFGLSGGHSVLKQWPIERFVELARRLHHVYGCRIVAVGGPEDHGLGQILERESAPAVINAVGQVTLRQLTALIQQCAVYVGNDAGPSHIAAAIGIPIVVIFGSSNYQRYGPWCQQRTILRVDLPCSPWLQPDQPDRCRRCIFDHPRCMLGIGVEQVYRAVEAALILQR